MNADVFARAENSAAAWGRLSPGERGRALARLRRNIVKRQEEIVRIVAAETGKPVTEVASQEVTAALEMLRFFEKKYPRWLRERKFLYLRPGFWTKSNVIVFEPLGAIAVIGPANFPFSLPLLASCAGLMCGNAVILKPSERCPGTASMLRSLFSESSFPEGIFAMVEGGPEAARQVAAHPAVRKVIVLGSYETGREIAEICGRHFKPCVLELGGKSAAVVCPEADLAWAARGIAWSAFAAAGRSCVGTKRVFVHASVSRRFVSLLLQEIGALRPGGVFDPGADIARLAAPGNAAKAEGLIRDALIKGAKVWTQDGKAKDAESLDWERPIVLLDVSPSMQIVSAEEECGPILLVSEVESVEKAVEETNSSAYGLGASVWSRDRRAAGKIARNLQAGLVWINDAGVGLPQFPWGGTKKSGWGRLFGEPALTELTDLKVISADRPVFSSRKFWWFPYSREKSEILSALNSFLYGKKTARRLFRLVRTGVRYISHRSSISALNKDAL